MDLGTNFVAVRTAIREALLRSGRQGDVQICAATKYVGPEEIVALGRLGIRHIGENRVQDAEEKFADLPDGLQMTKHLIGTLQAGKINRALKIFDCIQSVDSLGLAEAMDARVPEEKRPFPIFFQINIAADLHKAGTAPEGAQDFYRQLQGLQNLDVRGIMTIAPLVREPEELRGLFSRMRAIRDALGLLDLSMGMSNDYVIAVEEGATMVRIGSALFQ
ncbi:YggS family pyridoxal phosphate-dependent enzyme [Candidatus Woesearchaeota archaeon]|nr:YggS family pyridoxal phosphate-dependent enzyme [Candidatus Woesearchaeota archaeon]